MIWFVVWSVLVLGALALIAWLLRRLWRQAVALGRQLAQASDVLARLADEVDALQAAAGHDPHQTDPAVFGAPMEHLERLLQLRVEAAERRERRAERAARTAAGWRAYWS